MGVGKRRPEYQELKIRININLKMAIIRKFGTQADFAQAVSEREATVSRIVRGRRKLPTEKQAVWAKALGVKRKEIFIT